MSEITLRQQLTTRHGQLKTERATWFAHWTDITTYLLPRNGRYFVQDRNRGTKRHNNIYDSTGTKALRTLAAGLMGGLTSPARPWFRLGTSNQELMQYAPVKLWLNDVTSLMLAIFQKSNTYRALHSIYEELGAFGTACSIVQDDFQNVIHHYPLTAGEYCITQNWRGEVCTVYREFEKTVAEVISEFGRENCSTAVQNLYDRGSLDKWIPIIHAIEPREDRDLGSRDSKQMPWRSVYFERGGDGDKILRESGYKTFPAFAPRWQVAGGDIYGNSPGMEALGDIKQLQHEQLRKANAIDFQSNPPLTAPTALKNRDVERMPGGITYVDSPGGTPPIRSMFEVNLNLSYLLQDIQDVRGRINGAFYADIFMMLENDNTGRMTATEVAERHEEKMLMLGPVLERLQNELLDPLIETTFERMLAAGIVPPPPPELHGQDLNVELVSVLAQAQRAIATNGIDRFVGNLGMIAQFKPDVLDKFDADEWADAYSDMLGVEPRLVVPADKVALIRQQRAKAQQQAAQAQQAAIAAQTGANLAKINTGGKNAATDLLNMYSGYGSSPAGA